MKNIVKIVVMSFGLAFISNAVIQAKCCYNSAATCPGCGPDQCTNNSCLYGCKSHSISIPGCSTKTGECNCPYTFKNGKLMNGTSPVTWNGYESCPNCGHPVLTGHLCS